MPRFYFDVIDCKGFHHDEFGDECDDFEDARLRCQGLLPDIAREVLRHGERYTICCDVRDESGCVVYRGKLTYEGHGVLPDGSPSRWRSRTQ